jgi:hypothetical protein
LALSVVLALAATQCARRGERQGTVLDATVTWGGAGADTARTRHLPFVVTQVGPDYVLRVQPETGIGSSAKRPAHLRARILRPGGEHLIGVDFRLYPERHGFRSAWRKVWPGGRVTFHPDVPGSYYLQVQNHEPEVRRARVWIRVAAAEP